MFSMRRYSPHSIIFILTKTTLQKGLEMATNGFIHEEQILS